MSDGNCATTSSTIRPHATKQRRYSIAGTITTTRSGCAWVKKIQPPTIVSVRETNPDLRDDLESTSDLSCQPSSVWIQSLPEIPTPKPSRKFNDRSGQRQ